MEEVKQNGPLGRTGIKLAGEQADGLLNWERISSSSASIWLAVSLT